MVSGFSHVQRLQLDRQLDAIRSELANLRAPKGGWVRTIRRALGMTLEQLARRARIRQASVSQIEKSEALGKIRLDTLARMADALDCELVYALVPRRPLAAVVSDRLTEIAERRYRRTAHSMALENQLDESSKQIRDAKVDAIRQRIRPKELWREE
jgi:predicted DNA-binding mobile mystery protein A